MSIATMLDRKVRIERQTLTADASGGAVRTFSPVLLNMPCAASPASAAVQADYARRDLIVNYHVYTSSDLDTLIPGGVKLGDRVVDGADVYLVRAVLKSANAAVSAAPLYQIDCERRIS